MPASPTALPLPQRDAATLRADGRTPPATFRITLGDGRTLHLTRLLRVLPGKRIVGEARLENTTTSSENTSPLLLAKLFIDPHSTRHWQREQNGIRALTRAGIPTPALIDAQPLANGGHALLSTFLEGASTLLDQWKPLAALPPATPEALALLTPAFRLLGQVHAAGLSHDDVHLGNFLHHRTTLYLIDGDAVHQYTPPLDPARAARDLAMLIAQFPRTWDTRLAPLLDAYHTARPAPPTPAQLQRALVHERNWRLKDYLGKSTRDCTLFTVHHTFRRFCSAIRTEAATLQPLLADPDAAMTRGTLLKRGNTCTVARAALDPYTVVIKRYNLKNPRHALSRLWRPSRAWHAWREAHRLTLYGLPTPRPLALIEERRGPLRRRAWLITAYCDGPDMLTRLDPDAPPPPQEAQSLLTLFTTLQHARITHGDLKATNLLWAGTTFTLIDLDAMQQHRTHTAWQRAWRRDRQRLLRNWPETSPLRQWLDAHLPGTD